MREDLATAIRGDLRDETIIRWMLFVSHPTSPEVEMRLYSDKTDQQTARNYNDPANDLAEGSADGFVVYGDLILALGDLLKAEVDAA